MCRRRSGFTLIELLVVIAIIAILAAILFPVYAHVKEKGREASCKSNMKQIAYAMQIYLDEWNGCFPDHTSAGLTYTGSYNNQQGGEWIDKFSNRYRDLNGAPAGIGKALRPYVKSLGVFKCPSEWRIRPRNPNYAINNYPIYSSYYVKHAMCFYANYKKHPLRLSDIMFPTRASLLYEEAWHQSMQSPDLMDPVYISTPNSRIPPEISVGAIYFDCHVRRCLLPFLYGYKIYGMHWYWYDAMDKRIADWAGVRDGWDLSAGVHDRQ